VFTGNFMKTGDLEYQDGNGIIREKGYGDIYG
jgi:hypothetical protein